MLFATLETSVRQIAPPGQKGFLLSDTVGFIDKLPHNLVKAFRIVIVFAYAAGASLIMWLAEKINENGIGNGISIILFANIVASLAAQISNVVMSAIKSGKVDAWQLVIVELVLFGALAMVAFVVFITNSCEHTAFFATE